MQTTVVGSYPVPSWLCAHRSREALRDARLAVIKTQELAGIEIVSDGELGRFDPDHPETNGMIEHFVRPLDGVATKLTLSEREQFEQQAGMAFRSRPAGVVRGVIGEGTLDLEAQWREIAGLAIRPLKFTLTSPYMLAKTLLDGHYGDRRELCRVLADLLSRQVRKIDAPVVQIDEANLTGSPEDGAWAHEPINRVLDAVPAEKAVHLCFGNYGGATIQRGSFSALFDFLSSLHADWLALECVHRPAEELACFKDLPVAIKLGIGVIDIKQTEVEGADLVARRIEAAARLVGPERIRAVHPDCGFWMLPRSVADAKMRALVAGRDLYAGW